MPPPDKGGLAYGIFFLLGVGTLLPWNSWITAAPYFVSRFCGTPYETSFEAFFSVGNTVSQLLFLAVAVKYGALVARSIRVTWPLVVYLATFAIALFMVFITDMPGTTVFAITIGLIVLGASFGAFLSGGVFGMAGQFPFAYTQAIMGGQGLAGLGVSIAGVVTSIGAPYECDDDDDDGDDDGDDDSCDYTINSGAIAYFSVTVLVLAACVIGYFVLASLPITKYYTQRGAASPGLEPLMEDTGDESGTSSPRGGGEGVQESTPKAALPPSFSEVLGVLGTIKHQAIGVWFVFTVTIGLFPGLTSLITSKSSCSSSSAFYNELWVPLGFLWFNLFDFIGRTVSGKYPLPASLTLPMSLARVVFMPILYLCNVTDSRLPIVFGDGWYLFFFILFSLSNGWTSTSCMMIAPGLVNSARLQEVAGTLMIFFLTLGLASGAALSFVSLAIVTGSV